MADRAALAQDGIQRMAGFFCQRGEVIIPAEDKKSSAKKEQQCIQ